jgi:uncharacterized membrane protein
VTGLAYAATLATALGCGLVAGVFFAFSTFVMPALRRLSPAEGIAAMQSINRLAVTPVFMTALFGTALAALALVVWAAFSSAERPAALLVTAGALYVIGTTGVTMAANVPLNERLARAEPHHSEAGTWNQYVTAWTAWNHARALAALAAAALFTIALEG